MLSLAAMENEIRPKVLKTIQNLKKNYNKLLKYQKEKLDSALNSEKLQLIQNTYMGYKRKVE